MPHFEEQQDTLDASRAELDEQAEQVELGSTLVELSDGIGVVSEDGSTAIVNVTFNETRLELPEDAKQATIEHFESEPIDGVEVYFGSELAQGVPELFGIGEAIGLIFAGIVLIVTLGSLLAAALPIVTALVGIAVGVTASLVVLGHRRHGVDHPRAGRHARPRGRASTTRCSSSTGTASSCCAACRCDESIGLATGTSGTAVVFAGSTVIVALLALNVTGIPFLGLMGTVGAVCIAVAVLVAITLAPAILGLLGTRLLSRRKRATIGAEIAPAKPAKPITPMSNLRAILTVLGTVVALLVIAIPSMSMRLGLPDGGSEPAGSTSYQAFQIIEEEFGAGANGPLLVTATASDPISDDDLLATQVEVAQELADLDDVAAVAPIATSDDNTLLAFQVVPDEGPNSESTEQLVQDIRALPPVGGDLTLGVAGQAASNIDISEALSDALPIYLLVVVGLSFLIMILVFRSLLVPIIATGGFVLSLFATYGLIVGVFQYGWGASLIGLSSTGPILSFLPVILVGILFGLAMDYQLFLASGMREAYVHGSSAKLAVAQGFRAGRSVVTAAALIMVSVFGGFIFSQSTMIRSIGFGLAFGVLLDAFVVRMLLMPALMHLLGRSAWWLPRWLDRVMPNVDLEGASLERDHPGLQVGGVPRE